MGLFHLTNSHIWNIKLGHWEKSGQIEAKAMGEHLSTNLMLVAGSVLSYGQYVSTAQDWDHQ